MAMQSIKEWWSKDSIDKHSAAFASLSGQGNEVAACNNTLSNLYQGFIERLKREEAISQMQMQSNSVTTTGVDSGNSASYGHSEQEVSGAAKVVEYFYVERLHSAAYRLIPSFKVSTFRLAFGVSSSAKVNIPPAMYSTREEAEHAVVEEMRTAFALLCAGLIGELTSASLNHGLLDDADLDLADALRKYVAARGGS